MRTPRVVLAALACGACAASGHPRQVIAPQGVTTLAAYSPAVRANGWIFLSGVVGTRPGTRDLVTGGAGPQTLQALTNLAAVLRSAGATIGDVVQCTVYLVDMEDYAAMNEAYASVFDREPPARAAVAVAALPLGARVEIACVALDRSAGGG